MYNHQNAAKFNRDSTNMSTL